MRFLTRVSGFFYVIALVASVSQAALAATGTTMVEYGDQSLTVGGLLLIVQSLLQSISIAS